MATAFLQFMRGEATDELLRHPNCFALLALVAQRARREVPLINPHGLQIGEAMVGDPAAVGLSRQEFRTALSNLQKWGLLTTRATNKGTIAKLSNSAIYDINAEASNQQPNPKKTRKQPEANQCLTTNNKGISKEEIIEETTSSLQSEVAAPQEKKIGEAETLLPDRPPAAAAPGGATDVGTPKPQPAPSKSRPHAYDPEALAENLRLPFASPAFRAGWVKWRTYREEQKYRRLSGGMMEQTMLDKLGLLAGGQEPTALALIDQAIAKGWQDFYPLDKPRHETNAFTDGNQNPNRYAIGSRATEAARSNSARQPIAEGIQHGPVLTGTLHDL